MFSFKKPFVFFKLNLRDKKLTIEAIYFLFKSFVLLRFVKFEKFYPSFKKNGQGKYLPENKELASRIGQIISSLSKYLPWRTKCYEQAISAKQMLNRRKINSELVLGVKNHNNDKLFHAWVEVDSKIIVGGKNAYQYKNLAKFKSTFY